MEIESLIRKNILSLKPYSSARDEYQGKNGIFLDANENPYGILNRYPDPHQKELKQILAKRLKLSSKNIFIGNGSDEIIDLAIRIFCNPGQDKIIICPPTYGMYEVSARTNDIEPVRIPLGNNFQLNRKSILEEKAKMIFLCSPNNPTGNCPGGLSDVIKNFRGIVFVDQAYSDFSSGKSFAGQINKYPNLIVSQTMSKAWGLAGARIGIALASEEIISLMNKIKPPYNISQINQEAAVSALKKPGVFRKNLAGIRKQKKFLEDKLKELKVVKKIYPSEANFFLVEMSDSDKVFRYLLKKKIITRNRSSEVKNCIRITVGTKNENLALINALKKISL